MRKAKATLIGLHALLLLTSGLFAQKQTDNIPREEYFTRFRETLAKADALSRRQVATSRSIFDGKVTEETWTSEYQLPDRVRYLHVVSVDGKRWRTEEIDIGKDKYCKKNADPWTVITNSSLCIPGVARGVSGVISEVFRKQTTTLNGERAIVYSWYITHKNTFSKTADTDGESFSESKFWVDEKGLIVRYEDRSGLVRDDTARFQEIKTYEYDPTIKIEVPLKK